MQFKIECIVTDITDDHTSLPCLMMHNNLTISYNHFM